MTEPKTEPAPIVYLDMNVWVGMARGLSVGDPTWQRIHGRLTEGTRSGGLLVPLSPAHYLELWHRRATDSREDVARIMRDISGYATIPSPHVVRQREAEALVSIWEGAGSTVRVGSLVGFGAAHAFGRASGRLRFVTAVASADGARSEGRPAHAPDGWEVFQGHPAYEWFQLAGHSEVFDMEGLDRTPEHRFGADELRHELELREKLRCSPLSSDRLRDLVIAAEFEAMREYIEEVCIRRHVHVPASLRTGTWGGDSMTAIRDLVASIPTARTWSTLRHLKHRDHNLPWEQHDWTDLWALSVAIPYCDIVVTEKRWKHLAALGGLTSEYSTTVVTGTTALESALSVALS